MSDATELYRDMVEAIAAQDARLRLPEDANRWDRAASRFRVDPRRPASSARSRSVEFVANFHGLDFGRGGWREDVQHYSDEAGI